MTDDADKPASGGKLLALFGRLQAEEEEQERAAAALEALREGELPRPSQDGTGTVFHRRDHLGMAKQFAEDYYPAGLAYHQFQWWSCVNETSVWQREEDAAIDSALLSWLGQQWFLTSGLERRMSSDVAVADSVQKALLAYCTRTLASTAGVPLRDQLLTHGLLGKRIEPSDFVTWNLPLTYEQVRQAESPVTWLNFLETGLEGPDVKRFRVEDVKLLREFFGYCLSSGNIYQKGMWLQGVTRCGKSLILNVLQELLGADNVAARSATDFKDAANDDLLNKQLVYLGDYQPSGSDANQRVAQFLLNVIGDDPIRVRTLHVGAQKVRLKAKVFVASNYLLAVKNITGAVAARFLTIRRQGQSVKVEDPYLLNKLRAELPGILRWSLEGLADLQQRRGFDLSLIDPVVKHDTLRNTMPILAFLEDRTRLEGGGNLSNLTTWTPWTLLFRAWETYAQATGHFRNVNMEEFRMGVEAACAALGVGIRDASEKGQPGVWGIFLPELGS